MHDMMKRHEVQVLRRADVTQEQVAKLTGISLRSVRTIEAEAPVVVPDDAAERQTRGIGRPSKTEPFRGLVVKLLAEDPDLLSLEVRRAGASPSTGGALQCHGAPDRRVDRSLTQAFPEETARRFLVRDRGTRSAGSNSGGRPRSWASSRS